MACQWCSYVVRVCQCHVNDVSVSCQWHNIVPLSCQYWLTSLTKLANKSFWQPHQDRSNNGKVACFITTLSVMGQKNRWCLTQQTKLHWVNIGMYSTYCIQYCIDAHDFTFFWESWMFLFVLGQKKGKVLHFSFVFVWNREGTSKSCQIRILFCWLLWQHLPSR